VETDENVVLSFVPIPKIEGMIANAILVAIKPIRLQLRRSRLSRT